MTSIEGRITLARYVEAYEEVNRFRDLHYLAGVAAVATGFVIGLIGYCVLSHHLFGVNIGLTNNLIASIGGGAAVAAVAIIGVLLHYALKIDKLIDESSKERFFEALTDPNNPQIFDSNSWTPLQLRYMLSRLSDENWMVMMQHIDQKIFNHPFFDVKEELPVEDCDKDFVKKNAGSLEIIKSREEALAAVKQSKIEWVFLPLFLSDSERFIKIYRTMKEQKLLSPTCIQFLKPIMQREAAALKLEKPHKVTIEMEPTDVAE